MAVLQQAVAQIAEVSPGAAGFTKQRCLTITAGAVGLVGEQQASENSLGAFLPLGGG